jgi:hypothetical protein
LSISAKKAFTDNDIYIENKYYKLIFDKYTGHLHKIVNKELDIGEIDFSQRVRYIVDTN